jgi:DNA-binding CsgD family transcriptional regulator
MTAIDNGALGRASRDLGAAALDPVLWIKGMEAICEATGTTGAGLLKSDVQTSDQPWTPGARDLFESYLAEGWYIRDPRARGVAQWKAGAPVLIDQDIISLDHKSDAHYYNEFLRRHGFRWFAGIGFWADSSLWVLTLQRSPKDGPFDAADKKMLSQLSRQLTETATLSKAVGYSVIAGMTSALDLVQYPALVLDRMGFVLDVNAAADALFDDDIRVRQRRLIIRDPDANAEFEELIRRFSIQFVASEPIVLKRKQGSPLVIRVVPVPPAARNPFLGAHALLIFTDLRKQSRPQIEVLKKTFHMSMAEARLASVIAAGISPQNAAEELGIARETARSQLKSVFAKTSTHRQGELIALLRKL